MCCCHCVGRVLAVTSSVTSSNNGSGPLRVFRVETHRDTFIRVLAGTFSGERPRVKRGCRGVPFRISLRIIKGDRASSSGCSTKPFGLAPSLRSAPHRTAPPRADKKREHYDSSRCAVARGGAVRCGASRNVDPLVDGCGCRWALAQVVGHS